jgi:uncharacterized protein YggT (Ycf19 family)
MGTVLRLLYWAFQLYGIGLFAYVVLSWIDNPTARAWRAWLERFYSPFLTPLRRFIKPLPVGTMLLDVTPLILYFAVQACCSVVMMLLGGGQPLQRGPSLASRASVIASVISWVLAAYAVGLLVYVVLAWAEGPRARRARDLLGKLYLPVLGLLRRWFPPAPVAGAAADFTPLVLFLAVVIIREIILWVFG